MSPRDVLEASRAGDEKALRRARSPRCVPSSSHPVLVADASSSITTTRLPLARFPLRSDRPPVPLAGFRVDRDPPRVVDRPDDRRRPAPPRRRARIPRVRRDAPRERPDPPLPRDDERAVPLHYAAARGHDVIVRALLHAGAVPDARDDRGRTPAHYAAGAARRAALASLLDGGAHPDARDEDGRTPAHYAACADDAASVEELVARGANVDAMSARGMTPSDDARARRRRVAEAALARLGGRETSARYEPTKAGYEPTSAERQGEMERGRGDGGDGEIRVGSSRGGQDWRVRLPGRHTLRSRDRRRRRRRRDDGRRGAPVRIPVRARPSPRRRIFARRTRFVVRSDLGRRSRR